MSINDPITLPCGVTLKNRICKAAMTEGLADPYNRATKKHQTLYRTWAKGGAGLLITGNIMVDRRYLERPGNVAIDGEQDEKQLERLRKYAATATQNGADIWVQISHAGRQSPKTVVTEPVGPSAVEVALPGGQFGTPRALSESEIEDVINRFAEAARVIKETGFTGIQVHAAHGYLISEFLNPLTNLRTDQWGGSLENRARLLLTIVDRVREVVGADYPVGVKLNSSDFQKGGFSFEDCQQVVRWLDEKKIDLLEISGGNYEQPKMMGIEGMEPVHEEGISASTKAREAYFITYAEEISKTTTTPLMVTGGFRSVSSMNDALASGAADVIGIARPMCVDPDAPAQILNGTTERLTSWENTLALGPGIFGPGSKIKLLKALNGFGAMAFFYHNIFRLADGKKAKRKLPFLSTFLTHQKSEAKAGKALKGR